MKKILVVASLLASVGLAAPLHAEPVESSSRIAAMGGWQVLFNARFLDQAAESGHPLEGPSKGGPAFLGTFGYRPFSELEVAIELGFSLDRYKFLSGESMTASHFPLQILFRYSPFQLGPLTPYAGLGGGYLLNFFDKTPLGPIESHGAGPILCVGLMTDPARKYSFVAEFRMGFVRVELPGIGFINTAGPSLLLGVQINFPPEDKTLH